MKISTQPARAKSRIFLSPPHMGAVELAFVEEAFRTNYIAPLGPHVDAFEKEFAEKFGFKHAAAVSSGTAAIHLSLRLLGVKLGDEVVCSTFTFAASANPIVYERARPVFIDSDEATWNLNPDLLEEWLSDRAKEGRLPRAVVGVDLYGQCADMLRVADVCAKYGVPLVEDSAEALGASFAGRPAGSFGKTGIFSFNGNKIITTSGGGMLVSDDGELIGKARFLATQARDAAQHYQHSQLGFNYRMSNVLAGIGRAQLQVLGERVDARRRIFIRYFEGLKDLPGVAFMPEAPRSRSNRWLTCLTIDPAIAGIDSEQVRKILELENIEARLAWKPLHLQPVFAGCETIGGEVSERIFERGLCLPSGSSMTEDDCSRVIDAVRAAFPHQTRRRPVPPRAEQAVAVAMPSFLAGVGLSLREKIVSGGRVLLEWCDLRIGQSRTARFWAAALVYAVGLSAAFILSYTMRWDFEIPTALSTQMLTLLLPVVICKLVLLKISGQFRSILSYFGLVDLGAVCFSTGTVSAILVGLWYVSELSTALPRGVILMDFILSIAVISGFRLWLRVVRLWSVSGAIRPGLIERRVAIVGAGDVGEEYAKKLLQRRGCGFKPMFFIDEDPKKIGRSIHGLPIYGPLEELAKQSSRLRVDEFVVTPMGLTARKLKEVFRMCRQMGAITQVIPNFKQPASGEIKMDHPRPVTIEDLMSRDFSDVDFAAIAGLLHDQVVLVTGAGGSVGGELCRQVLAAGPRQLLMLDQSEYLLFEMEQEFSGSEHGQRTVSLIADVKDEPALRKIFATYRPALVFHAAALKHVSLLERHPREAILNNVLGTAGLAYLANEYGVSRFILLSTEKAGASSTIMGSSMRLAEETLRGRRQTAEGATKFITVRFGNILGSNGSVVTTFKRQIAQGGPVTVTHAEMTRHFMTAPDAAGLILHAALQGHGGEIYILDMGRPVKILDLARQMIELSGLKPDVDIKIKFTGLRPGESLVDEKRLSDVTHVPTSHPQIYQLQNEMPNGTSDDEWLEELRALVVNGEPSAIRQAVRRMVAVKHIFSQPELTEKLTTE